MSNFSNFSNQPHRYSLEKGSKKHRCPNCGKKSLKRYIDAETGEYLPQQYGRCDHENSCVPHYHLNPYLDGYAKMIWVQEQKVTGVTKVTVPKQKYSRTQPKPQPKPEPVFFDFDTFKQTLQPERYEKNTFIQNLFYRVKFPFDVDDVTKVIQLYRLGTAPSGATCFPFIDVKGNVSAIQEKHFDHTNSTDKSKKYHTSWTHARLQYTDYLNKPLPEWLEAYTKQDKLISCLFGEHLLSKYPNNPVALVEAPKTAVYGTLYFGLPETPETRIWLAVGAKGWLNFEKAKVLQGRFVHVFPDLSKDGNTFNEWQNKAQEYEKRLPGTRFIFSDLLEGLVSEREKHDGYDLADYIIKLDWRLFSNTPEQPPKEIHSNHVCHEIEVVKEVKTSLKPNACYDEVQPYTGGGGSIINQRPIYPELTQMLQNKELAWQNDINELEAFFSENEFISSPVILNNWSVIENVQLYISSHLEYIKHNNGKPAFLPYLDRLKELKDYLSREQILNFH